jgi:hypothetical protein
VVAFLVARIGALSLTGVFFVLAAALGNGDFAIAALASFLANLVVRGFATAFGVGRYVRPRSRLLAAVVVSQYAAVMLIALLIGALGIVLVGWSWSLPLILTSGVVLVLSVVALVIYLRRNARPLAGTVGG